MGFRSFLGLVLGIALSPSAYAQTGDFHLVVWATKGGVTSISFPTAAKCEAARQQVLSAKARQVSEADEAARRTGGAVVEYSSLLDAACIRS